MSYKMKGWGGWSPLKQEEEKEREWKTYYPLTDEMKKKIEEENKKKAEIAKKKKLEEMKNIKRK